MFRGYAGLASASRVVRVDDFAKAFGVSVEAARTSLSVASHEARNPRMLGFAVGWYVYSEHTTVELAEALGVPVETLDPLVYYYLTVSEVLGVPTTDVVVPTDTILSESYDVHHRGLQEAESAYDIAIAEFLGVSVAEVAALGAYSVSNGFYGYVHDINYLAKAFNAPTATVTAAVEYAHWDYIPGHFDTRNAYGTAIREAIAKTLDVTVEDIRHAEERHRSTLEIPHGGMLDETRLLEFGVPAEAYSFAVEMGLTPDLSYPEIRREDLTVALAEALDVTSESLEAVVVIAERPLEMTRGADFKPADGVSPEGTAVAKALGASVVEAANAAVKAEAAHRATRFDHLRQETERYRKEAELLDSCL